MSKKIGSGLASASGTVEEIEEHRRAGKPAMIYFSSAPVRLDSVDDQQYAALRSFKEECRKRSLIEEYDSIDDFREKFTRQLAQTVIREWGRTDEENRPAGTPATPRVPSLSEAAQELLIEAAKDGSGTIMCLKTMQGSFVKTNGRTFTEPFRPIVS